MDQYDILGNRPKLAAENSAVPKTGSLNESVAHRRVNIAPTKELTNESQVVSGEKMSPEVTVDFHAEDRSQLIDGGLSPASLGFGSADKSVSALLTGDRTVNKDSPDGFWQPDLDSKDEQGLYRFAPATVPWNTPIRSAKDIPRLPGLSKLVRSVETAWAESVGRDPQAAAQQYLDLAHFNKRTNGGPLIIETDEIKMLCPFYREPFKGEITDDPLTNTDRVRISAAVYNRALHATATGIARIAFEKALGELPPQSTVLVMTGGVAAGKGYAVANLKHLMDDVSLVLDPDGESSQTFIKEVYDLCKEAGHKLRFVGVRTDPETAWTRSLSRAKEKGRLPDEALFAHSHSIGVSNQVHGFEWLESHGDQNVETVLIDNSGDSPQVVDPSAVEIPNFQELYDRVKSLTEQNIHNLTPWHAYSLMQGRGVFTYVEKNSEK